MVYILLGAVLSACPSLIPRWMGLRVRVVLITVSAVVSVSASIGPTFYLL